MVQREEERLCALTLRANGASLRTIAAHLGLSVSTASAWTCSVQLTEEQRRRLFVHEASRQKALAVLKKKYLDHQNDLESDARARFIRNVRSGEFLLGLGLYWAEGAKSPQESRVSFTNTDTQMLRVFLQWARKYLHVTADELVVRLHLHIGHMHRERQIVNFWHKTLGVPAGAFRRTIWIHAPWKREYENDVQYHGVLTVRVRKSKDRLRTIRTWLGCLKRRSQAARD
jgi:transposase